MTSDYTRVDFAAMKEAQANFQKALSSYTAILDDLKGKIQTTLADWEGDARRAYEVKQDEWNRAGAKLGDSVHKMGQAIGESHDGYRTTENRNTQMFGG
ncbi:WXG100 family type VII secretion target [Actinomadura xylanilytica]|uniref:WXG100 family type VII secretion target n=1 Tax=Actinomadura xylanilytica TaxID=887459 RepID=UPI00255AC52B|nr:WXG100 family type VII secretion target [Actinomadura xylanilytica]MDL4772607.1 WXG100 family type VII secretion target [Actinomadura xylanilytica]